MGEVRFLKDTNTLLRAVIEVDAELILHSNLGPEWFIDQELNAVKEAMLECFYGRFPKKSEAR